MGHVNVQMQQIYTHVIQCPSKRMRERLGTRIALKEEEEAYDDNVIL